MQVAVNFQNETIAQKVLWILEHFKNDGVDEINFIKQGKLTPKPINKFLNEL